MIKVNGKRVKRIYLGKSNETPYFVGQLIPSMQKIDDPRFLLCDGSAHTWTDAQKAALPTKITSRNAAPNMLEKTVAGLQPIYASLGTLYTSRLGEHSHNGAISNPNVGALDVQYSSTGANPSTVTGWPRWTSGQTLYTGYFGSADGTSSKRTYVYWYLYIGDE